MNFRDEREKRDWSLQYVAEQTGYSVAAINGLELHNKGGYELRVKLNRLYGNLDPAPYGELQDRVPSEEPDLEIWRRRAKAAEKELHLLKSGMRRLLGGDAGESEIPAPQRSAAAGLVEVAESSWDPGRKRHSDASPPVIGEKLSKALDRKDSLRKERGEPDRKGEGQ